MNYLDTIQVDGKDYEMRDLTAKSQIQTLTNDFQKYKNSIDAKYPFRFGVDRFGNYGYYTKNGVFKQFETVYVGDGDSSPSYPDEEIDDLISNIFGGDE